ncbi:phosphomannomutase/phosphoglucomutase [bacterium]|nr:phosphomannomutase/phosphoglucomutase [bacterium]
MSQHIFREYDIRGVADTDFADKALGPLSKAIGTFLRRHGQVRSVAVGRDCRTSSPRIAETLKQGLMSCGLKVVDVGEVPTPVLYFSVPHLKTDAGIMITGSHNPPEYNGFKIALGSGTLHGAPIQAIGEILRSADFLAGDGFAEKQEVLEAYWKRIVSDIQHPLGLKVVVDSGNGMGGVAAPELFRRLGCEVTELFSEPDGRFPNHHPDPTVPENLTFLLDAVKKQGADVGVGFDGDADRIGAVDPTGRILFGDELLALYARQVLKANPGATIISDVKASNRLFDDIAKHGGRPILWKTGHSLIKAKMKEENALLAGEMSGHMFFRDRYYGFDDAIYAAARLFEILAQEKRSPAMLLSDLPPSFVTPELRVDCPDATKFAVVEASRKEFLKQGLKVNAIDGARVEFSDGWGLVRASNTQPVLVLRFEASTEKRLQEIRGSIEGVVKAQLAAAN